MRRPELLALATTACVAAAVLSVPASPALALRSSAATSDDWSPPVSLSGRLDSWDVRSGAAASAAVTPGGTALVVWATHRAIRIAHRPPGGPWQARALYRSKAKRTQSPVIAVDDAGTQTVVWVQGVGPHGGVVRAMRRPYGSTWGPAVRVALLPPRQSVVSHLDLAVARNGMALLSFWRGHVVRCPGIGEDCTIDNVRGAASLHTPSGWNRLRSFAGPFDGVWGYANPSMAPGSGLVARPSGVVVSSGSLTVGWTKPGYMQEGPVFTRTRALGSPWDARQRITPRRAHARQPRLVSTSWGQVTAAWNTRRDRQDLVLSRTRLGAAPWGPLQRVAGHGYLSGLGVDGTGAATALINRFGAHAGTYVVQRPRWRSWGPQNRIGPSGGSSTLRVNPTGESVAAWQSGGQAYVSFHDSADPWTRATVMASDAGPLVNAGIGADDTAAVVWYRTFGRDDGICVLKGSVRPG